MDRRYLKPVLRILNLLTAIFGGLLICATFLFFARISLNSVRAAPIEPPEGYPKFNTSTKVVSPTLANTGGEILHYIIDIINTGAYTATDTYFTDIIPAHTRYNDDSWASMDPQPSFENGTISWVGTVGFDSSVQISFSVVVDEDYEGIISNTAVIDHSLIAQPVTVTSEAMVTDFPLLVIDKTAEPKLPGANKPLTYTLTVVNMGEPVVDMNIFMTDILPANTSPRSIEPPGYFNGNAAVWDTMLTLDHQQSSTYTFSVNIGDVTSGTIINNQNYSAEYLTDKLAVGDPYTVTVIDPILKLSKESWPFPPGSNREMTYTITVLNKGSLATDLIVKDTLPAGVEYRRGGTFNNGIISWELPFLDTDESRTFTYTVYIADIAEVPILNDSYGACNAEGVCATGEPITSVVGAPTFEVSAAVDPIAHKPGGGNAPVTPTLTVHNIGPGNALDAVALLQFSRISISNKNFIQVIPDVGILSTGPACGDNCRAYQWIGDISYDETITFTVYEGESTIGGDEGTNYTATIIMTDTLGDFVTTPISATAIGNVTHFANLIPSKDAPSEIGAGQDMTYTITVFNSGLSTDEPPYPWLSETVPDSTTLISVSDGAEILEIGDRTVISWTLPAMSPGDQVYRSFMVKIPAELISGTQIVNDEYKVTWWDIGGTITETGFYSNTGEPITTVVKEIGLIDSFKEVTPTLARPGPGNVLTYVVSVVNSSPFDLTGVRVNDLLPWESSTYQRDGIASTGTVLSDIVSLSWRGNVAAYSTERITMTVLVDEDYEGPVTNTAIIKHPSLKENLSIFAVAYITNDPVLFIEKFDKPDPVRVGNELQYTIRVTNLGQQASELVVTDTIPINTLFVVGSASSGGKLLGNTLTWEFPVLTPGESRELTYSVRVLGGEVVVNDQYGVTCAEGVSAKGKPVTTIVILRRHFLPLVAK
jgi:uncharacterized repeat protein (TIGR01451 family)